MPIFAQNGGIFKIKSLNKVSFLINCELTWHGRKPDFCLNCTNGLCRLMFAMIPFCAKLYFSNKGDRSIKITHCVCHASLNWRNPNYVWEITLSPLILVISGYRRYFKAVVPKLWHARPLCSAQKEYILFSLIGFC